MTHPLTLPAAIVVSATLASLLTADSRPQVERRQSWACEMEGQLWQVRIAGRDYLGVCRVPPDARVGRVVLR